MHIADFQKLHFDDQVMVKKIESVLPAGYVTYLSEDEGGCIHLCVGPADPMFGVSQTPQEVLQGIQTFGDRLPFCW